MTKYNRLELLLMGYHKTEYIELDYYAVYGAYRGVGLRFLSYEKNLRDNQKYAIIQDNLKSHSYNWNDYVFSNIINIYSFSHIRKNNEHIALQALTAVEEIAHLYWERWGVLEDGTILQPKETEKIIKMKLSSSSLHVSIPTIEEEKASFEAARADKRKIELLDCARRLEYWEKKYDNNPSMHTEKALMETDIIYEQML